MASTLLDQFVEPVPAAMNLGPFSAITLTYYVALWHPDEWARLGRRLRRLGPTG